ncbi:hypothetical protein ACFL4W_03450, partial [Planctomycetota bacterium]
MYRILGITSIFMLVLSVFSACDFAIESRIALQDSPEEEPAPPLPNTPPELTLLGPDGIDDLGYPTFTITWIDEDLTDDATIALYYDDNAVGCDGVEIVAGLSEDDTADSYFWNTSSVPEGLYYLYAKIDDGEDPPVYVYSAGRVAIFQGGIQPISFPDPEFEALIRQEIGIPIQDLYPVDLIPITSLIHRYGNISDMTGIEFCVNLNELNFERNNIT